MISRPKPSRFERTRKPSTLTQPVVKDDYNQAPCFVYSYIIHGERLCAKDEFAGGRGSVAGEASMEKPRGDRGFLRPRDVIPF